MSVTMDESIKRWTAKRKTALVVEIIQGKTTVAEASRAYDLSPSEIEGWLDDAKRGMENALRANPLEIRELDLHRFCSGHVLMLGGPLFEGHW